MHLLCLLGLHIWQPEHTSSSEEGCSECDHGIVFIEHQGYPCANCCEYSDDICLFCSARKSDSFNSWPISLTVIALILLLIGLYVFYT